MLVGDRVGDVSTFADEDLGLCETFAGHASVLLENGRLERSLAQVTELTEELHHQAYTDALTQLPNRLLFAERLGETLEGGDRRTHAVLFLDLDRLQGRERQLGTRRRRRTPRAGRAADPGRRPPAATRPPAWAATSSRS